MARTRNRAPERPTEAPNLAGARAQLQDGAHQPVQQQDIFSQVPQEYQEPPGLEGWPNSNLQAPAGSGFNGCQPGARLPGGGEGFLASGGAHGRGFPIFEAEADDLEDHWPGLDAEHRTGANSAKDVFESWSTEDQTPTPSPGVPHHLGNIAHISQLSQPSLMQGASGGWGATTLTNSAMFPPPGFQPHLSVGSAPVQPGRDQGQAGYAFPSTSPLPQATHPAAAPRGPSTANMLGNGQAKRTTTVLIDTRKAHPTQGPLLSQAQCHANLRKFSENLMEYVESAKLDFEGYGELNLQQAFARLQLDALQLKASMRVTKRRSSPAASPQEAAGGVHHTQRRKSKKERRGRKSPSLPEAQMELGGFDIVGGNVVAGGSGKLDGMGKEGDVGVVGGSGKPGGMGEKGGINMVGGANGMGLVGGTGKVGSSSMVGSSGKPGGMGEEGGISMMGSNGEVGGIGLVGASGEMGEPNHPGAPDSIVNDVSEDPVAAKQHLLNLVSAELSTEGNGLIQDGAFGEDQELQDWLGEPDSNGRDQEVAELGGHLSANLAALTKAPVPGDSVLAKDHLVRLVLAKLSVESSSLLQASDLIGKSLLLPSWLTDNQLLWYHMQHHNAKLERYKVEKLIDYLSNF